MKEKIGKLDFIQTKNFLSVRDTAKRMKREATHWEEISANHTPDKELLSKMYKGLLKLNNKKTTQLKNG